MAGYTQGQPPASGGGSSAVPTLVLGGDTFTVEENTQALFRKRIKLEDGGRVKLNGILVEV